MSDLPPAIPTEPLVHTDSYVKSLEARIAELEAENAELERPKWKRMSDLTPEDMEFLLGRDD